MPSDADQNGFSLLEAVIALAIASFALIAAYHAFSGGLANTREAALYARAAVAAETLLMATPDDAWGPGERAGQTPDGVEWRLSVSTYVEPGAIDDPESSAFEVSPDLYLIRIETNAGGRRAFVLETLRWAGDDDRR